MVATPTKHGVWLELGSIYTFTYPLVSAVSSFEVKDYVRFSFHCQNAPKRGMAFLVTTFGVSTSYTNTHGHWLQQCVLFLFNVIVVTQYSV